ncbi:hypothetical protein [uncultured Capnocytophaga sp.]|uniref:hypothetical protein n=1 Tax=uncultured Capnocytophaga sp. TaxID=159273 RepID=UPI0026139E95|nr:hypothetical protein [uncultured Capnocytophaga sp.]
MSRQLNFYATDADRKIIADILCEHFGEMIEVPSPKDSLHLFEDTIDKELYHLTDTEGKEHITYREHTYHDLRKAFVLDEYNSSILEYSTAFKNPMGAYVSGRFYTCTNHKDFSAKVAKFFTKLKKVFIYLRPQRLYISKNIDLDSALFLLSNKIVKLSIDGTEEVIEDVKKTSKKAPSVKVIPDKMNIFNKK